MNFFLEKKKPSAFTIINCKLVTIDVHRGLPWCRCEGEVKKKRGRKMRTKVQGDSKKKKKGNRKKINKKINKK